MKALSTTLIAATLALSGVAHAQGTGTKAEMDRGVPGVDVNVGKNAKGAVDVNTAPRNDTARGVPGVDVDVGKNANGAVDVNTERTERAPRADRG